MSGHASKFEELLKADTARMSLEFVAYGAVIGFVGGGVSVLIFQDMLKAVMS